MRRPAPIVLLALLALASPATAQNVAEYAVRFDATWSPSTHPSMFPSDAHFSPLVGAAHSASVAFWAPGATASPGIEQMAETGATTLLRAEIAAAGDATGPVVQIPGLPTSPGSQTLLVAVSDAHPLVTLVTMVAPSPDWFVGVHGLDLRDGAGGWQGSATIELFAYDAGTDSGTTYTSPNLDTQPREPIARLTGPPFDTGLPLGTLTFERLAASAPPSPDASPVRIDAPSPARAGTSVRVTSPPGEALTVWLADTAGRRVASLYDGPGGARSVRLPSLAAGVYLVVATAGDTRVARALGIVR